MLKLTQQDQTKFDEKPDCLLTIKFKGLQAYTKHRNILIDAFWFGSLLHCNFSKDSKMLLVAR